MTKYPGERRQQLTGATGVPIFTATTNTSKERPMTHTPIAVPCEELDLILNELGQGIDLPGDVITAIERVRGRFPANWAKPEPTMPEPRAEGSRS